MEKALLEIINEILEDKNLPLVESLNANMSLRKDLGFDSMDLAFLTAKLDEDYNVDIFDDGIVDTIDEILKKLA